MGKFGIILSFLAEALFALRGLCVLRWGQDVPSFPHAPFLACGAVPSLRSGQVFLDEAEHFLHNRYASVATLRGRSGSSRNAVRLPFGIGVRLRRNPHFLTMQDQRAEFVGDGQAQAISRATAADCNRRYCVVTASPQGKRIAAF